MEDVKEGVLALIDVSTGNGDMEEQERLMLLLLDEVTRSETCDNPCRTRINNQNNYKSTIPPNANNNGNHDRASIRQVFSDLNAEATHNFAMTLADCMAHRSDPILPPTQDVEANEVALTTTAISVTRHAFLAARLYVAILSMPGSWGAGFVDVGALSNLSALIRRWCVECTASATQPETLSHHKGKRKGGASKAVPLKKKRANEDDDDFEHNCAFEDVIDDSDDPTGIISSPLSLRQKGLELSKALAQIPAASDFLNWSEDALEVVLDAVACAFMTSAALQSSLPCEHVVDLLSQSLTTCAINLASASIYNEEIEVPIPCASQSTMIFILRGIFATLSLKVEVPYGQKGKEMAHAAAARLLTSIIDAVSKQFDQISYHIRTPRTPASKSTPGRSSPHNLPTPRTGRTDRKKRVSFGTVRGKSIERIMAPALKEVSTPLRNKAVVASAASPVFSMLNAIVGILQKIITLKDLDRSDVRRQTMLVLTMCLPALPQSERTRYLRFVVLLCSSKMSVHRLSGSELIGKILCESWFWEYHINSIIDVAIIATNSKTPSKSPLRGTGKSMPRALLGSLISRLSDKAPAVRTRAAVSLSEVLNAVEENDASFSADNKMSFHQSMETVLHEVIGLLRLRALEDDRATVRKAAILTLSKLSSYCQLIDINDQDILLQLHSNIELFGVLCSDASVAARKSASSALTDLLLVQYASSDTRPIVDSDFLPVEKAWTSFVLPLVLDSEPACVNNAVEHFYRVVVSPLIENKEEAWRILACVSECTEQQGSTKAEYEALKAAVRKVTELDDTDVCISLFNRIRDVALSSICDDDVFNKNHSSAVWCILRALTDQSQELDVFTRWIKRKSVGHEFLVEPLKRMFETCKATIIERESSVHASLRSGLFVLSQLAAYLPVDVAAKLAADLRSLLGELHIGPEVIGNAVSALIECTRRHVADQELRSECAKLVDDLYAICEQEIADVVLVMGHSPGFVNGSEERLVRAVYLSGELAMVGFRSDESGTEKEVDCSNPIIGMAPKPSTRLLNLIQALLPRTLPGDSVLTPEAARAHAFVALGKLCLRDERFAKECLNLFARELHQNLAEPCIAVQSNALLVLGDLCFKYTNLVDRYLPVMAACLQSGIVVQSDTSFLIGNKADGAALVRKHAVLMLSGLLLQDYIKWRGLMFHRFLVATSDTDEGVAALAEMTLCGPLLAKFPRLFLNNFVESLLVLNRCTAHPIYLAAASVGDNGAGIAVGFDGIDLSGSAGQARRYHMYKMMLSKMSDEEKIGVAARLSKDILGAAVQTEGDLGRICRNHGGKTSNEREEAAFNVLSDAFHILTSSWICVGRAGITATDEEDDVEDPNLSTTGKSIKLAVAKGRLLSSISRKQMVEIILPILCNLKSILQTSCSPLLKELSTYLREMYRANKTEVKEFLANDPTLLQEVEYDSKIYTKSQRGEPPSPGGVLVAEN